MGRVLKVVLFILGGLVTIVVLVVGIGALLPVEHEVSRAVVIEQPPSAVWDVITDFASAPQWRPDVQRVERLPDRDGSPVWVEYGEDGQGIPYATLETEPPHRLVREIADPNLPFGGTWTFELESVHDGTRVTITERGQVHSPIFRFVSKFFIGHDTFMVRYLAALGSRFGQEVQVAEAP